MSELGEHDISDDCPVCNRQLMTAEEWAALNTEEGFDEILGDDDYQIVLDDASGSGGSDDSGSDHSEDRSGDGCTKSRERRATNSNGGRRDRQGNHGHHDQRNQHGQHGHHEHDYDKKHSVGHFTKVIMPTGSEFSMPVPATPQWKCSKWAQLYTLDPKKKGQREYQIIEQEMERTIVPINNCETNGGCVKHFNIIKIQRVIQPCAWRRYVQMKRNIEQETNGNANEHMLFHGSDAHWAIVRGGFDERHASTNGQFGAGLYFADKSSMANQFVFGYFGGNGCKVHQDKACYICARSMLLCRVLLGNTKKMSHYQNMAHAPIGKHSITATGGGFKHTEYVVYRGEQAYPEYRITYKIVKPDGEGWPRDDRRSRNDNFSRN